MMLDFYGLREQPFGVTPDPRFLFLSEKHQEAIAKLEFGIRCNRGFIVLIAPPGLGKTTLLYHMLETFRSARDTSTAFVFQTQCTSTQLVRQLISDLGIDCESQDIVSMNQQLHRFLVQQANSGRKVVLFLDEAQNLSEETLETVRLLSNFETSSHKLLQIVLAGQPPLAVKLAKPSLHQLKQRVFAVARLKPLNPQEADAYISHRLSVAGCNSRSIFTPQARSLLVESSKGIPREINALCFGALAVGYALQSRSVDEAIARQSILELTSNDLAALDLIETSATIEDVERAAPSKMPDPHEPPPVEKASPEPVKQATPKPELPASPEKGADRETLADIFQTTHTSDSQDHARTRTVAMVAGVLFVLLLSISAILYSAHLLSQEEVATQAKTSVNTATGTTSSSSTNVQASPGSPSDKRGSRMHSSRTAPPATNGTNVNAGRSESAGRQQQQFTPSGVAPAVARVHESPASIITAMSTSNTPSSDRTENPDSQAGTALNSTQALGTERPGNLRNEAAAGAPPTLGALIYSTTPLYPASARDDRIEGTVVLKAVVASNGAVVRAERVSGSPVLADAAIEAVRNWKYRPATSNGRPVEVETWIVLRFTLPKQ